LQALAGGINQTFCNGICLQADLANSVPTSSRRSAASQARRSNFRA
jgi:hypothetical protein